MKVVKLKYEWKFIGKSTLLGRLWTNLYSLCSSDDHDTEGHGVEPPYNASAVKFYHQAFTKFP